MTAPSAALNARRGTPSQSAHENHWRVSSTNVSPTSKKTAFIAIAHRTGIRRECPWRNAGLGIHRPPLGGFPN